MAEWHVTPDYIVNNWTDELLNLMTEKLEERKKRENDAVRGIEPLTIPQVKSSNPDDVVRQFSEFRVLGSKMNVIKVVKHGN